MTHTTCSVTKISSLTPAIYEVILTPPAAVDYKPGQYLKVVMSDEDARPFSIANAPHQTPELVLHIGATPENPYAWEVMEKLRNQDSIVVDIPDGSAFYQASNRPVILLAGGTGFSYVHSILQSALHQSPDKAIDLYWGVRSQADLYCVAQLNALSEQHANFNFKPVVQFPEDSWQGLSGWVHKAVIDNTSNLADYDVYVAGRFEMAKVVRDDFTALGFPSEQLFGDAFSYL